MIVITKIREVDLHKINIGSSVKVFLDAYPDKILKGTITYIDTIAQSLETSSMKFFETLITLEHSDKTLRSGMSARIDITYDIIQDKLTIPIKALHFNQDNYFVYINQEEKTQNVEIGRVGIEYAEVLNGLQPKTKVFLK